MPTPSVPYIVRRPIPLELIGRAYCPGTISFGCSKDPEWTVMHPTEHGAGHPAYCADHAEAQLLVCQAGRCAYANG